jgi:ParB family transcriptional regulator, chromosome partitioning protein
MMPEVLRRADLAGLDGEDHVEGQGVDIGSEASESVSDTDLPAFLTEDLLDAAETMMAEE